MRDVVMVCGPRAETSRVADALGNLGVRTFESDSIRLFEVASVEPKAVVTCGRGRFLKSLEEDRSVVCLAIGKSAVDIAVANGAKKPRNKNPRALVSVVVQRFGAIAGFRQKDRFEARGALELHGEETFGPYSVWMRSLTTGCFFAADSKRKNYLMPVATTDVVESKASRLLFWCVLARAGVRPWPDADGLVTSSVSRFLEEGPKSPRVVVSLDIRSLAALAVARAARSSTVALVVDSGSRRDLKKTLDCVGRAFPGLETETVRQGTKRGDDRRSRSELSAVLQAAGANVDGDGTVSGSYAPFAWVPREDVEKIAVELSVPAHLVKNCP